MSNRRHQIFVSSTFNDLKVERRRVWETLVSLNHLVAGMENFPATTGSQLEYIKRQIAASDYFVLILAGRYGTVDGEGVSYTEREFYLALELQVPVLCFSHRSPEKLSLSRSEKDLAAHEKLAAFRERAMKADLAPCGPQPTNWRWLCCNPFRTR